MTQSKFILGDCMDPEIGLPSYPDNYFDLAIVDPPYGIGEDGRSEKTRLRATTKWSNPKSMGYKNGGWDSKKPSRLYFDELIRVSKNQIIWGANHFGNMPPSPCWVIWDKKTSGDFADAEIAWTSFKSAVRIAPFLWSGFKKQVWEHRIHPTQKPIPLYCWLLENYANSGDLILDTHVGSASSLIACESMGFKYVGYEIDPDYYEAATRRMKAGIQKAMF